MVWEIGRIRKRLAVCVADGGDYLSLYDDHREDQRVDTQELGPPTEHVSVEDPPAVRLHEFEQLRATGAIRTKTQSERILEFAARWSRDLIDRRALFDAAVARGWSTVAAQVDLTPTERAWRTAHHAASVGDLAQMLDQLSLLPESGYSDRVALVLAHLPKLRSELEEEMLHCVARMKDVSPIVPALLHVLGLVEGPEGFSQSVASLASTLSSVRSAEWQTCAGGLEPLQVGEPPAKECRIWAAVGAFQSGQLEAGHLDHLPLPYLEAAISDADTARFDFESALSGARRNYALARTRPDLLDLAELAETQHFAELARRAFVHLDTTAVHNLPQDDEDVRHYDALLRFRERATYSDEDLRPQTRELLTAFAEAREQVASGSSSTLPDRLLADPTLWPALQQLALDGKLSVGPDQRHVFPEFAEWVDLHSLVAMLWSADFVEAAELGRRLAEHMEVERVRDEALNLRAFALAQIGRPEEALTVMEDAMAGEYTESLLVNTCLIAAETEPEVASSYLARLVEEAPSDELRIAALRRAIDVWTGEEELPEPTAEALRSVLESPSIADDDYVEFFRLRSNVDRSALVANHPQRPTTLTKAVAYDLYLSRAMTLEGESSPSFFSGVLVKSMNALEEAPWLRAELDRWVDLNIDVLMTLDLGEAIGSATAIDAFLVEGPEHLSRPAYYIGAARAGIHLEANFVKNDSNLLSTQAEQKFLYRPLDEFLTADDPFDEDLRLLIRETFFRMLALHRLNQRMVLLPQLAQGDRLYNELTERQRWDHNNSFQIRSQRRSILQDQIPIYEAMEFTSLQLDRVDMPGLFAPEIIQDLRETRSHNLAALDEARRLLANI